jgi:peroxiredoxin (alkyl hydroperoxide reductase subunit C)
MEPAPDFEAKSTHGIIRLSDFTSEGMWVLLFSHPADFTPVCSTEFIEFARSYEAFQKINVQLIGVSIDSVYSHIAWVRDLEQIGGIQVKFPVIADLDQKVSAAYGLVHDSASDTATIRAVFAIDPTGNIRALIYYPMQIGWNIDEIFRLFPGLADCRCQQRTVSGELAARLTGHRACSGYSRRRRQTHQRQRRWTQRAELVSIEERPSRNKVIRSR